MFVSSDRITGAIIAGVALILYFLVIPGSVESVDSGWLLPQTFPNALSLVIAFFGAALIFFPSDHELHPPKQFLLAAAYLGLLAASLYAMSYTGFMIGAPFTALSIMLLIGERRLGWLAFGVIAMPAFIWICVVWLLERSLP